jgi:hypothetical protein
MHKLVDKYTKHLWGADTDIDNLSHKRESKPRRKDPSATSSSDVSSNPDKVSLCYGEPTAHSFLKIFNIMCTDSCVPQEYRLTNSSILVDLGSGYGRFVFAAKILCNVAQSIGIEYSQTRHDYANKCHNKIKKKQTSGNETVDINVKGVKLLQGDLCSETYKRTLSKCTHVYAFDARFSDDTMHAMCQLLNEIPFKLFCSFRETQCLQRYGLQNFKQVTQRRLKAVGGQSFTCRFYAKHDKQKRR